MLPSSSNQGLIKGEKRAQSIRISDMFLFMYLCVMFGNNLDNVIERYLKPILFVLYILSSVFLSNNNRGFNRGKSVESKHIPSVSIWTLVFWFYAYISISWSQNISFALAWRSRTIQTIGLVISLSFSMSDYDSIRKYMSILVASNVFATVLMLTMTPLASWGTERMGEAIGVNSNLLSLRASYSFLFLLYLFLDRKRPLYIIAMIPLVISVFFAGSRKGVFTLVASPALYLILRDRGFKWLRNVLLIAIMVFVTYQIVMYVPAVYEVLGKRVERLVQYMTGGSSGGYSEQERQYYREYARYMWQQKPVLGWGLNQFAAQMEAIGYRHVAYCHNNYFELLSCLGIVGFILYYSFLLSIVRRLIAYLKYQCPFVPLALAMLIVMLINDYGLVSFREIETWVYLALLSAMSLLASSFVSERDN